MEENAQLSSKILSLESHFDEIEENDMHLQIKTAAAREKKEEGHLKKLETLQQELKRIQYTNSRLIGELASKEEWIKVLLEHIRLKNLEINRIKVYCVDLKVEFDQELEIIAKRIHNIITTRGPDQLIEPNEAYQSPLRNSLNHVLMESPVFDVLRKSMLLGQSIEFSRQRPGSRLLALTESHAGSCSRLSIGNRLPVTESIDLTSNVRESAEYPLIKTRSLRRSIPKCNTIKRIRGGNSILKLNREASDDAEGHCEQDDINIVNGFDVN
jgi:hypothetical protein